MKLTPWLAVFAVLCLVQLSSSQQCKKEMKCMKGRMEKFMAEKGSKVLRRVQDGKKKLEKCFRDRSCTPPRWDAERGDDDDDDDGPPGGSQMSFLQDKRKEIKQCVKRVKTKAQDDMKKCLKRKGFDAPELPKGGRFKKMMGSGFGRFKRTMDSVCKALQKCPRAASCIKDTKNKLKQELLDKLTSKRKCVQRRLSMRKRICAASKECVKGNCKNRMRKFKQALCECKKGLKDKIKPRLEKCFPDPNSIPFFGDKIKEVKKCMSDVASSRLDDDDDERGGPGAFCSSRARNPCEQSDREIKAKIEKRCEERIKKMGCFRKMQENAGGLGDDMIDQCASGEDANPIGLLAKKFLGGRNPFGGGRGGGGGLGGLKGLLGGIGG